MILLLAKKIMISLLIFAAFCTAGYLTSYAELWHESLLASFAIFGASFISILAGIIKVWYVFYG